MPDALTWEDIRLGSIIRYEHLSRAKRLAGKRLTVRRGRVEVVYPPPRTRDGQITITVLNKDGSPNARLGRISIYGLGLVLSVEDPDRDREHVDVCRSRRQQPCNCAAGVPVDRLPGRRPT